MAEGGSKVLRNDTSHRWQVINGSSGLIVQFLKDAKAPIADINAEWLIREQDDKDIDLRMALWMSRPYLAKRCVYEPLIPINTSNFSYS